MSPIAIKRRQRRKTAVQKQFPTRFSAALLLIFLFLLLLLASGIAAVTAVAINYLNADLKSITQLEQLPAQTAVPSTPIRLFAWGAPDESGRRQPVLLNTITPPPATWMSLEEMSPELLQAAVTTNDPHFWQWTPGAADVARALTDAIQGNPPDQLPSPITNTLINQYLLSADSTTHNQRQAQAWWLAWQMHGRYPKTQLLEWYLNTRPFGRLTLGPEAAAQLYFGKSAAELTLSESLLLFEQNSRTQRAFANANTDELGFEGIVVAEVESILGQEQVQRGGLDVYTSLDLALQWQVECVTQRFLRELPVQREADGERLERYCPAADLLRQNVATANDAELDAAVLVLDPVSGQMRAMTGDVLAEHEPGTLLAPFVYLTALSQGYNAATMVLDVETAFEHGGGTYRPQNVDGRYHGPLRIREAFAQGSVVAATHVMSWVGPKQVVETASRLGLVGLRQEAAELSLLSGGGGVNLLDTTFAFATLDNLGVMVGRDSLETGFLQETRFLTPTTIWRVTDDRGNIIYDYQPQRRDILTPPLAYLMNDLLVGDATAERPMGLINGTTADGRHNWAVGYTPQLVVGTWVGDSEATVRGPAASPIRDAVLQWATLALPTAEWQRPPGLRELEVCDPSGLLPTAHCPTIVQELFIDGTQPTTTDVMFQHRYLNRQNGRFATITTPPHLVERRVYQLFPPEAAEWAAEANIPAPPTEYDTIIARSFVGGGVAAVVEPEPFAEVSGEVVVRGTADSDRFATYRLAYFPGLYPEDVLLIGEQQATAVVNGTLGMWDTSNLDEGLYTLLLTVVNEDGTFTETAVPLTVNEVD